MQMGVDISAFINMAGDQLFSISKNIKQKQQNNKNRNKKHEGGRNSDAKTPGYPVTSRIPGK